MSFLKKNLPIIILSAFLVILPILSFAADIDGEPCDAPGSNQICNPIHTKSIDGLVKKALEGAIKIGIPIIALAIIYSGFLFVFARGNSEKLTEAKSALLYTLIGAGILLGAWSISQIISETVLAL